jgi:hypothetical protein
MCFVDVQVLLVMINLRGTETYLQKRERYLLVTILGVYPLSNNNYLMELRINKNISEIKLEEYIQISDQTEEVLEVEEYYLNDEGTIIIGDSFNKPEKSILPTRIVFILKIPNFEIPLSTPFGNYNIPLPAELPERLKEILFEIDIDQD